MRAYGIKVPLMSAVLQSEDKSTEEAAHRRPDYRGRYIWSTIGNRHPCAHKTLKSPLYTFKCGPVGRFKLWAHISASVNCKLLESSLVYLKGLIL